MALSPLLALLQKLLDLCRRWASRSLPYLLKLFSVLARRIGLRWPASKRKSPDVEPVREVGDARPSGTSSCVDAQVPPSLLPTQRTVVLACASTPPRAHTREHTRSMDSIRSLTRSPTLYSPSLTENGYDGGYCTSPTGLAPIKESAFLENGCMQAEPASIGVPTSPSVNVRRPMKAIAPSQRPRYSRNAVIENNESKWSFGPLSSYDLYKCRNVGFWQYHIHPEGNPYYLYKQDSPGFSYLTEANLKEDAIREEVESFTHELEERVEAFDWDSKRPKPKNVEVVLEIQDGWAYYMVDLDEHVVFWLDDLDMGYSLGETYFVESRDQFRNQLDIEYWQHIEHFPNHQEVETDLFTEVLGMLNYWRIDTLSSADSTAPYEPVDLHSFIESLKSLQASTKPGSTNAYASASLARLMSVIGYERHFNFYGSYGARLQVWQSVRGDVPKKKRLWLVSYLSPILFYAPDTHLAGLEKLWVDGTISERRWKKFQLKLERDWEGFVLYSTVLLNANVALLSTPIIYSDNAPDGMLFASPAAVASQVSIITSIASIIIGLLLVRQVRISAKDIDVTAEDAMNYLCRRKHAQLGLETMAIQYSLPYALLMWGMVTFLAAIAVACFYSIDGWPNALSQILYACIWFFTVPLILWTVLTGWETKNHEHWTALLSAEWWKKTIRLQWVRSDKKKPWTWRVRRKGKKDLEASDAKGLDASTVTGGEAVAPTDESATPTVSPNRRRWHVRVMGPVRRLTFNSFMRS